MKKDSMRWTAITMAIGLVMAIGVFAARGGFGKTLWPEIAAALGEEKRSVSAAMEAIVEPVSLYESVYNDGEDSVFVIDQLCDRESGDDNWIEDISLREAMKRLNERERNIIEMRFFRGRTQMEIATEIGISQAQVSRLEKGALERMRRAMS